MLLDIFHARIGMRVGAEKPLSLSTGDVIYHEVEEMGAGKRRPCLVIAGSKSQVFLIPLSSANLNPSINPVIRFKGGISFAVLDHVFNGYS